MEKLPRKKQKLKLTKQVRCSITADEIWASNFVLHSSFGRDISGLKDFKQYFGSLYEAFPDLHFALEDVVVEGDKAAVRYLITGTHKGAYMGIPPTNMKVSVWAIEMHNIIGGKYVECWSRKDTLSLMQQLRAIPTPKK
jgi:hypothetical protein